MDQDIIDQVCYVIQAFDQANTNGNIGDIGSRGRILAKAIVGLKTILHLHGIDPYRQIPGTTWKAVE